MAELGQSGTPSDLIPGNPETVLTHSSKLRERADTMDTVGSALSAIDAGGWNGPAADSFRDRFSYEPPKWLTASDAMTAAADALEGHGVTLQWGHNQAAEAVRRYDHGMNLRHEAEAKYNAERAADEKAAAAQVAAGGVAIASCKPFVDPGAEDVAAAHDILNNARSQVHDSGERAAAAVRQARDTAPEAPGWFEWATEKFDDFGTGVQDFIEMNRQLIAHLIQKTGSHNPVTLLEAFLEETAHGIAQGIKDPKAFAEAITDAQMWKSDPARALGRLLPNFINVPGGGGATAFGAIVGTRLIQKTTRKLAERALEADIARTATKIHPPTPGDGPVVFYPKKDWTPQEIQQLQEHVDRLNQVRVDGQLSETGRVSTKGALRDAADSMVDKEHARANAANTPYQGHPGHVPDTTWTGKPDPPGGWQDMSPRVNQSVGGQVGRYPIGWKPTEFVVGPPR